MVRTLFRRQISRKGSACIGTPPAIEQLEDRVLMSHHRAAFLVQTNLVSDVAGRAATVDANLVNAWGIAAGGPSPFWVNANGAGTSEAIFNPGVTPPLYAPQTINIPAAANNVTGANPT